MKRIVALMVGLSFALGTATLFAQEPQKEEQKTTEKKKKAPKKKKVEKKDEAKPAAQ